LFGLAPPVVIITPAIKIIINPTINIAEVRILINAQMSVGKALI
jgi:hypothetical protein